MATLDLAGIITRVCTDLKEKFASKSALEAKQDKLVSGTNIKTINSTSLLGSGNISVATSDKVGYQLRTNDIAVPASDTCGPYRLWFTSADGTKMVPINTNRTNSSTATKTLNTRPIDPFGRIMYYDYYATAGTGLTTNGQWDQYSLAIAYSYVKALTNNLPVYLKCTPQSNGSAVMADVVQALPSTNDGYIYIFLGMAYNTTKMELLTYHPVYWHDGTGIRLWTGAESGGGGGSSSWTDISSLFMAESPDPNLHVTALTNGQMVYVTGLSEKGEVVYPNGYYPSVYAVGSLVEMSSLPGGCVADPTEGYMQFSMSDGTAPSMSFMFSILYPISSS